MGGLALSGLTKRFGKTMAVDAVDLRIGDGEFVSLLGPSGCGKTTTLRLIAGFFAPDAGEIRAGERVISRAGWVVPPEQRNMSMIFQSYAVWPHMTVTGNVAYGLRMRSRRLASRFDSGSSSSTTRGSCTRARASATRCC